MHKTPAKCHRVVGHFHVVSPLQKVRTLLTQCRALKWLEGQKSPSQRPNRLDERKHGRTHRLFYPFWLPLLPSFLPPFCLRWPYSGPPEAVQPPDIDHRRRPNDHTGHAEAAPYRGFPSRKEMSHTAHDGFYRRPQVPSTLQMLAGATLTFCSLPRFGREAQDPRSQPLSCSPWPEGRFKRSPFSWGCMSRRSGSESARLIPIVFVKAINAYSELLGDIYGGNPAHAF